MMRSYFLTGCTGFIGSAIVRELCKRKDTQQIVLLTRNPQARYKFYSFDRRIKLYEGNVLTCRFPDNEFTDIIHGSNESQDAEPHSNYYTMVEGTQRMMSWAFGRGGFQPHVLLLSSGAAATADTPYGQGKRTSEIVLRSKALLWKIARIYTLIGEENPTQYAVGEFIRQAKQEGRVTVTGGVRAVRSYLHTADAARWLGAIMDSRGDRDIFDVGGTREYAIVDVARLVAKVFRVPIDVIPAKEQSNCYIPDLAPARAIGLKETISLKQALERIRDDHRIRNPHLETAKAA
jgi:nucleoside-diphosphate-sugar epimerase